jgi:uncharacterized membrane protein HdeD (DUF308 family)
MNTNSSLGDPRLAGREAVRRDWGWFLVLGILLMGLGAMALAASGLMTLGTMVFFGCLLIVGGVMQLINAVKVRGGDDGQQPPDQSDRRWPRDHAEGSRWAGLTPAIGP